MVKRTVLFTNPSRLTLKNAQLVVENHETGEVKTVPIEDIGVALIENQMVSISVPALNALNQNNCAVVFCDTRHMPSSMLMNLDSNSIQAETYRYQIGASIPLKKNLWKQVVEAKIRNQANLLSELGKDGDVLRPYYSNVKSGDSDNREGIAAKIYWDKLFNGAFIRSRDGADPNSLLNYGYAILRAGMARAIMGSGLFPAFSLFHKNRYNAFPLADDLMEPYRPYVDQIVYSLFLDDNTSLNTDSKQAMLRLLFIDTRFKNITRPLEVGLTMTTASLVKCLRGEQKQLSLPVL
jgi:CRISPR-associated protein Cas1